MDRYLAGSEYLLRAFLNGAALERAALHPKQWNAFRSHSMARSPWGRFECRIERFNIGRHVAAVL